MKRWCWVECITCDEEAFWVTFLWWWYNAWKVKVCVCAYHSGALIWDVERWKSEWRRGWSEWWSLVEMGRMQMMKHQQDRVLPLTSQLAQVEQPGNCLGRIYLLAMAWELVVSLHSHWLSRAQDILMLTLPLPHHLKTDPSPSTRQQKGTEVQRQLAVSGAPEFSYTRQRSFKHKAEPVKILREMPKFIPRKMPWGCQQGGACSSRNTINTPPPPSLEDLSLFKPHKP